VAVRRIGAPDRLEDRLFQWTTTSTVPPRRVAPIRTTLAAYRRALSSSGREHACDDVGAQPGDRRVARGTGDDDVRPAFPPPQPPDGRLDHVHQLAAAEHVTGAHPRVEEKRLDDAGHSVRPLGDCRMRPLQLQLRAGAAAEQLDLRDDAAQRGPELVRQLRRQLLLVAQHRRLPREEPVERRRERVELSGTRGRPETVLDIACAPPRRLVGHLVHGAQRPCHDDTRGHVHAEPDHSLTASTGHAGALSVR
jgi:hypothetical protein